MHYLGPIPTDVTIHPSRRLSVDEIEEFAAEQDLPATAVLDRAEYGGPDPVVYVDSLADVDRWASALQSSSLRMWSRWPRTRTTGPVVISLTGSTHQTCRQRNQVEIRCGFDDGGWMNASPAPVPVRRENIRSLAEAMRLLAAH